MQATDRTTGERGALAASGANPVNKKDVLIKPNFNTADPAPGSRHNRTLVALVDLMWETGAALLSLGERSYPPTRQVMRQKGVLPLLEERQIAADRFFVLTTACGCPYIDR